MQSGPINISDLLFSISFCLAVVVIIIFIQYFFLSFFFFQRWKGDLRTKLNVKMSDQILFVDENIRYSIQYHIIFVAGFTPTSALSAKIQAVPLNTSYNPGENVTLICLIQCNCSADAINWYKDNNPIGIQNDVNSLESDKMSLLNISRHDAGKYNCTAWKNQEFATDEFNLHVNSKSAGN